MSEERSRRVRFHGRVQFKTIRHVADFGEDEINEGWYRKKDFMRMSEEVGEIAQMVSEGKETQNGEEISIRGLEHLVEEDVADYRAEKMIASIDAVLDEQDEQRDEEINDPDVIAQMYSEIVTPLLREAYLVGLRDAKEAQEACESIPDVIVMDEPPPPPLPPPPESSEPTPMSIDAPAPSPRLKKKKEKPNVPKKQKSKTKKSSSEKEPKEKKRSSSKITVPPKPAKAVAPKRGIAPSTSEEGEELLNFKDDEPKAPKKQMSKEERRAAAEARKSGDRKGKASEMSPLVRRRDGSFAFRNKDTESANAALKKERRDAVKDSLFKFLDSADDDLDII